MRQYQPTPDFYHDYIAHHGIQGMSWGVRNGPPYPLDRSISTGKSLKKGGQPKKKKSETSNTVYGSTNKKMFDKDKEAKHISEVANDHQDMFNDLLYEAEHNGDIDADEQSRKLLREIAKENGIKVEDLGKEIYTNYQAREQQIQINELNRLRPDRIKELSKVEKVSNSGDPRKFKNFISTDKGYKKYWERQGISNTDAGDDELNELMFMEYEEWLRSQR